MIFWAALGTAFLVLVILFAYLAIYQHMHGHKHDWSEWEDGLLRVVDTKGKYLYTRGIQDRRCNECGFKERRNV